MNHLSYYQNFVSKSKKRPLQLSINIIAAKLHTDCVFKSTMYRRMLIILEHVGGPTRKG